GGGGGPRRCGVRGTVINDAPTTEVHPLSLHDALPICRVPRRGQGLRRPRRDGKGAEGVAPPTVWRVHRGRRSDGGGGVQRRRPRSEEHTSELQSRENLVCRLLLEKKK